MRLREVESANTHERTALSLEYVPVSHEQALSDQHLSAFGQVQKDFHGILSRFLELLPASPNIFRSNESICICSRFIDDFLQKNRTLSRENYELFRQIMDRISGYGGNSVQVVRDLFVGELVELFREVDSTWLFRIQRDEGGQPRSIQESLDTAIRKRRELVGEGKRQRWKETRSFFAGELHAQADRLLAAYEEIWSELNQESNDMKILDLRYRTSDEFLQFVYKHGCLIDEEYFGLYRFYTHSIEMHNTIVQFCINMGYDAENFDQVRFFSNLFTAYKNAQPDERKETLTFPGEPYPILTTESPLQALHIRTFEGLDGVDHWANVFNLGENALGSFFPRLRFLISGQLQDIPVIVVREEQARDQFEVGADVWQHESVHAVRQTYLRSLDTTYLEPLESIHSMSPLLKKELQASQQAILDEVMNEIQAHVGDVVSSPKSSLYEELFASGMPYDLLAPAKERVLEMLGKKYDEQSRESLAAKVETVFEHLDMTIQKLCLCAEHLTKQFGGDLRAAKKVSLLFRFMTSKEILDFWSLVKGRRSQPQ